MNRRTRGLLTAVAVLLGTAACGGDDGAGGPAGSAGTRAPSAPTASAPAGLSPGSAAPVTGVYTPRIDPAQFSSTVDNPYFPLRPRMRWEYRSATEDGVETTVVQVTGSTHPVLGVPCVEVRDTVRLDGQVIEDTLDWYAQDRDGTVWYFGEDTKEYEDGKVVSTEGSWTAGVNGAHPGIIMPAQPRPGDRYRQEYYRGHAEDLGEVLAVGERVRVPAGSYDGVVRTKDTTPLEPDVLEHKYYAAGVGPVLTIDVSGGGRRDELVSFTPA